MEKCMECGRPAEVGINGHDYCGVCASQVGVCQNCHETVAAVDLSDRNLCIACEEYSD